MLHAFADARIQGLDRFQKKKRRGRGLEGCLNTRKNRKTPCRQRFLRLLRFLRSVFVVASGTFHAAPFPKNLATDITCYQFVDETADDVLLQVEAGVPLITPRRPVALVRANVAADRIASTAPKRCKRSSSLVGSSPTGQRVLARTALGYLQVMVAVA